MMNYSEFEIQSEAFQILKYVIGEKYVRGEYCITNFANKIIRVDIALVDINNNLHTIIEVKKKNLSNTNKQLKKDQKLMYELLTSKPVVHINGMDEAKCVIDILEDKLGKTILDIKYELHDDIPK